MKSAKCYGCGFVGWSDAGFCKKCGAEVTPNSVYGANQPRQSGPGDQGGSEVKFNSSLATWSLVLGIVSFLTMGLFGLLATAGIALGIIALVRTSQNPSQYTGKGRAIGGLVLSSISAIAVPIGIIAAIAIPNLLAARRAANEGASIAVIKRIFAAESTYQSIHGTYGSLDKLASEHLIDLEVASSPHYGYRFAISEHSDPLGFELTGVPESYPNSGLRSFYIDETGVIHVADRHGTEATKLDPPLRDSYPNSPYRRTSERRADEPDE